MDANDIRIALVLVGALILGAIYWFGRPKRASVGRLEPIMPWQKNADDQDAAGLSGDSFTTLNDPDAEAEVESDSSVRHAHQYAREPAVPQPGERAQRDFDQIISLHVMARDEGLISGSELIVAAEKASLVYGAQGLFHRLVDGRPEAGPIFSMVNRIQPGRFDLSKITELSTPGVSFFMALPCALAGLDAWDRMLPAAQRLAGLLNAEIYDDEMNLLGRQRIASIRDELRAYDRKSEIRVR
jgi:cell division protein ZipA